MFAQESAPAAPPTPEPSLPTSMPIPSAGLKLKVRDALRLGTLQNSDLKESYYQQLLARAELVEAGSKYDPVVFSAFDFGTDESIFASLFPTGNALPNGEPEFFQTIVTDRSTVLSSAAGVRGLIPTGATYELRMNTNFRDRERGGLVNPSLTTTSSLTVTQPLLRAAWLQYSEAPILQARNNEKIARTRFRSDVLRTAFDVEQAYWELVFSIRNLDVANQSLELARRQLEINRVKVRTGVLAPIEVVAAEASIASRESDAIIAENAIRDRKDSLRRLILAFRSRDDWNLDVEPLDPPETPRITVPTLEECVATALEQRPDIAESRIQLKNLAISVAVADNETLPSLDLKGSVNYTGLNSDVEASFVDSFGDQGAESWNVGFVFELPIGNEAAKARLARSRLARDQAIFRYRNLQLNATEAVRRAYRNVVVALNTIESRQKAAQLKREELRNEQVKFDNGRSTNFQVLQVQDDLAQRQIELLRSQVDYRLALSELAFAVGSTTDVLGWTR